MKIVTFIVSSLVPSCEVKTQSNGLMLHFHIESHEENKLSFGVHCCCIATVFSGSYHSNIKLYLDNHDTPSRVPFEGSISMMACGPHLQTIWHYWRQPSVKQTRDLCGDSRQYLSPPCQLIFHPFEAAHVYVGRVEVSTGQNLSTWQVNC